ncbi:MAG: NRDE family protein [Bacteroidales bacterium]|jgi:uncharacterized protein with NRDE domain|nr:NRDE family protein [Bacteroidales bacterium]MDY0369127.1 NRDE family protein [Bacteroidales bacterium]
MCLIALAYQVHPGYPLILIANRDEFYERPTREARFWVEEGHPDILAGKDLLAGGTWMGVQKTGKWAALTNYRDLTRLKSDPPSRGELVLNYLKSNLSPDEYIRHLQPGAAAYNDFNLLIGDNQHILHYSNFSGKTTQLKPGIHGLSNALLNTPWHKTELLKARLEETIRHNKLDTNTLFQLLTNETMADDDQLPETGLSKEMEKAISPAFIITEKYGTRCSTLLLIDENGHMVFTERRFKPASRQIIGETEIKID